MRQLFAYRADDPQRRLSGIVLEVKGDLCRQLRSVLRECEREQDYVEVSLDGDVRYNPLNNDLDPYAQAFNMVVLQLSNADRFVADVCRRLSSGCQIEKAVDELNLAKKAVSCHPSNLPLPDHMNRFVTLNRSPGRLEFSEALLGVHSTFDGSRILVREWFKYCTGWCRQRLRSVPSFLLSGIAEPYIGARSVLIMRWTRSISD
jgi:hypothetical protein